MKIKRISCEQFAGVRDMDVSFGDGLNVVYGKNESGKSTLVHLLSRTLFQNTQLDKRSDKDFIASFFPSVAEGKQKLESIDGKVKIETERGDYTLAKEWGESERLALSTPDGVLRDPERVREALKEVLLYGEGVYEEMLFSSQRNADGSLRDLLNTKERTKAKQEIADVLTRAFLESDGVSLDALQQAIDKKIEGLCGHWDAEADLPEKKSGGGRWQKGLGAVLEAYYRFEDKREERKKLFESEKAAENALLALRALEKEAAQTDAERREFEKYTTLLLNRASLEEKEERLDGDEKKYNELCAKWPRISNRVEKAQSLAEERKARDALERFESARRLHDGLEALLAAHGARLCPSAEEIGAAKAACRRAEALGANLGGMNLFAEIQMLSGDPVTIRSLKSGAEIRPEDGKAALSEAVDITVPNVMRLRLSPADVDVSAVTAEMQKQRGIAESVFCKYRAESVEALEGMARQYADEERKIELAQSKLELLLGGASYEELKRRAAEISFAPRSKEEIDAEAASLCGGRDLSDYIAAGQAIIGEYVREYQTPDALKERLKETKEELARVRRNLQTETQDIPKAYLGVDPERFRRELGRRAEALAERVKLAEREHSRLMTLLESYQAEHGESAEEADAAERTLRDRKAELSHWLHIRTVFDRLRENISSNPMQDLAESFSKYLTGMTQSKVSSRFPSGERLDVNVFSDGRPLDFDKLSEGTKETVSLAFRLAVLDHLFPHGGGVIVLDDPLCDMDAERSEQAARLITACAKRHQVIFLTCRKEYADCLKGNYIEI